MPGNVNLVRPDGKVVSVTQADARLLLGLGYRPEEAEEVDSRLAQAQHKSDYSGGVQTALAFGEGAVGAILPGADYLMADEATRSRAEYNPTARFLGELGGSLLPGSPVAKVGSLATGAAGKVFGKGVSKVIGGVVEGAAFGAQSELTRSALSGDPVTAEQMLAGMGLGAVFGGGAMALAHGMESYAARVASGKGVSKGARELANDIAPKVPQASVDEFFPSAGGRNPYDDGLGSVVSGGADIPYTGGRSAGLELDVPVREGPLAAPHRYSPQLPKTLIGDNAVQTQDAIAQGIIEPGTWNRLRTTVKEVSEEVDNAYTDAVIAHDRALTAHKKGLPAQEAKFDVWSEEVIGGATLKAHPTPRSPGTMKVDAWDAGRGQSDIVNGIRDARRLFRAANEARDGLRAAEARDAWKAAVKDLAKKAGMPEFAEMAAPAASRVDDISKLHFATKALSETMPHDVTEYLLFRQARAEKFEAAVEQVLASKLPEAAAAQSAMTKIIDEMTERAGISHQGGTAQKLRALGEAGHGTLSKVAADFNQKAATPFKTDPRRAGPVSGWTQRKKAPRYEPPVDDTVDAGLSDVDWGDATTPAAAVKSGGSKQGKGLGADLMNMARREGAYFAASTATGQAPKHTMRAMARYSLVALFMGAKGLAMEGAKTAALKVLGNKAAAKVVSKVGPRAFGLYRSATGHEDSEGDLVKRFKARSDELRNLAIAGRDQAFAFSQGLAQAGHPEFAYALYQAAVKAQDTIVTRLPKDPPGTRWGTEWVWDAPPEQVEVFAQEYCAAFNPLDFLEAVSDDPGAVHPSAVKVFEEAWPSLYAEFRATAITQLLTVGTEGMDTESLTSLSVLFDLPFSPLNDPAFIAAQQASYAPENQPQPPKGGGSSGSPGRPPGADATAAQRLSMR